MIPEIGALNANMMSDTGVAGHRLNAYYDGKNVCAIDGQTGQILGWPPDMDAPFYPATHWDCGVPK